MHVDIVVDSTSGIHPGTVSGMLQAIVLVKILYSSLGMVMDIVVDSSLGIFVDIVMDIFADKVPNIKMDIAWIVTQV
jgi:hypothetical protein